jgi:hypothetical protein
MPAPVYSPAVLRSWIEALERYPCRELTPWEEHFVESVSVQLELRGSLSPKQVATLERIYAAKTA